MCTKGNTLYRVYWKLTAKGAVLVYFAMFEILVFFEKFPTFYLKQLLENVWLTFPVRLSSITESKSTVQQDI